MPSQQTFVFGFRDADKRLAYVWHSLNPQAMEQLWQSRYEVESGLNDYLRTLTARPSLDKSLCQIFPVYKNRARTLVRGMEKQLKAQGYSILSERDRASIDSGIKPERAIYVQTAWGRHWFRSVTDAARALKMTPSAVTQAAQSPNPKIEYADIVDELLS